MDNQDSSLVDLFKKGMKEMRLIFIIIISLLIIIGITKLGTIFKIGYKYYSNNEIVAVTQEDNLIDTIVKTKIEEIDNEGVIVASYELPIDIEVTKTIINTDKVEKDKLNEVIKNNLKVEVLAAAVTPKDSDVTFYFKSENEADTFIQKINMEYTKESSLCDYKDLSTQEELEEEYAAIETERARVAAEVASRAAARRTKTTFPLASYTYISSGYGQRSRGNHTGIDLASPSGTTVYSWKCGKVTYASWNGTYGNFVEVQHDDGTISRYAHLSKIETTVGATVESGTIIGKVGSTGNSTGPHLHFEIKINGSFVNPAKYLGL